MDFMFSILCFFDSSLKPDLPNSHYTLRLRPIPIFLVVEKIFPLTNIIELQKTC